MSDHRDPAEDRALDGHTDPGERRHQTEPGTPAERRTADERDSDLLLVVAVLAVAVAARLSVHHVSPLPYNTDAFVFVQGAERVLAADGVAIVGSGGPAPDEVLFVTLIATVSDLLGVAPMTVVQVLVACLAVAPCLVAMWYARALTDDLPRSLQRGATAVAGLALALEGPYLFRTMSVNAEVYGLALLACGVLALQRALDTAQPRWIATTVGLGLLLPFAHNLSALVAGLVGTVLVALAIGRDPTLKRAVTCTIGVAGFWLFSFGYYELVDLARAGTLSSSLGLFLAWVLLVVALARWLDVAPRSLQRGAPLVATCGFVLVFVANAVVSIYPGTATTSPLLVLLTLPLTGLLVAAAVGLPRLASDRGLGAFALLVGPLAATGFALTGGRTPDFHDLLLRSTTFVHLGLVVAGAVGLATLAARRPVSDERRTRAADRDERSSLPSVLGANRPTFRRVAVVVVIAGVLVSAPLPFAGLAAFPFEPVTEPDELAAATFAAEHVDGGWAADDHVALVAYNYRGAAVTDVPTTGWLRDDAPPPDCPTVGRSSWTTVGTPTEAGSVRVSDRKYEDWVVSGDVVYAGGADSQIVLRWRPGQCRPIGSEGTP